MAYAGQQCQHEAIPGAEKLDPSLICGCCYSAGIYCDVHSSINIDVPSQQCTTRVNFDDDEAWTTNDSRVSLDFYQFQSSSVHSFEQASTDAISASEESSSRSFEDEQFPYCSKPCCKSSVDEQHDPLSLRSWGQSLQNCSDSSLVESLLFDEAHNQVINPTLLTTANKIIFFHEANPKKRQRTQEEPETVQPHEYPHTDVQSTDPTRISLLDPQTLLEARSSEHQLVLHQLQGIYAEFTSPLNPQSLRTIQALAALLDRLARDWLNKPSRVKCLIALNDVPVPPAARDPNEPYICVCGCGYKSSDLISWERHLSQNWLASYWQCPLCDIRFASDRRDMLSAHLRSKKHSKSGERVDKERDYRHNICDDDFEKQCGFCGKVCHRFKDYIKHVGAHFRDTSAEPPNDMRKWRKTWDDDDSDGDSGKSAEGTSKKDKNGDRHVRGGGSNGSIGLPSEGGNAGSSKGPGHSRDCGYNQDNSRSNHSSTYNSRGSGFRTFDSSSTERSLSLADTALPFGVRHIREIKKAGGLPLRPKKNGKQTQRPLVAEGMADVVEVPILTRQNAFPQVSDPPRRVLQDSEVIFDAAERWKAFRLKYDRFGPRKQDAKARELSSLRSSLGASPLLQPRENKFGRINRKIRKAVQGKKRIELLANGCESLEEASQNGHVLDMRHNTKQKKRSEHRTTDGDSNIPGDSRHHLVDDDPLIVDKLFDHSGSPSHVDDIEPSWSDAVMSLPSMGQKKNAGRPLSQCEDTASTTSENLSFKLNASSYKKQESKIQQHVPGNRDHFAQRHRDSSWLHHPMAEPIGLAAGLLALVTFAFQSSITLYNTIGSFRSHPNRVRDLIEELEALGGVLSLLSETVSATTDVDLSTLDLPLLRYGNACKTFEQEIMKRSSQSGGSPTSFRDWAKSRYIGEDMDGFRRLLARYRLTINIALTDANLRKSSVTAESLQSYKDLITTTTANLEAHLETTDEKLEMIFEQNGLESDSDVEERRLMKKEQLSMQKCLQVCTQLSEHIDQIQLTLGGGSSSSTVINQDPFRERITNEGLQECNNSLLLTAVKLEKHVQDLMDQMMIKLKTTMTSKEGVANLTRLRDEWETARQGVDICSKAYDHLKENIATIDNYAMGDAVQFLVSTDGKTVHGKNRGLWWRTRQVGGHLNDTSVQQLPRDLTSISIRNNEREDQNRRRILLGTSQLNQSPKTSTALDEHLASATLDTSTLEQLTTSKTLRTQLETLKNREAKLSQPNGILDEHTKKKLDSIKQCLTLYTKAIAPVAQKRVHVFEDIEIADDEHQVILATSGGVIAAKRVTVGARSTQWLGQMSDSSLRQLWMGWGGSS